MNARRHPHEGCAAGNNDLDTAPDSANTPPSVTAHAPAARDPLGAASADWDNAVLYSRVGPDDAKARPDGLYEQMDALRLWAEQRGWGIVGEYQDVGSGWRIEGRLGLAKAIARARETRAVLMASKLDRLVNHRGDLAGLVSEAEREGWALLPLNLAGGEISAVNRVISLLVAPPTDLKSTPPGFTRSDPKAALVGQAMESA